VFDCLIVTDGVFVALSGVEGGAISVSVTNKTNTEFQLIQDNPDSLTERESC
jgi:hypothetical protein